MTRAPVPFCAMLRIRDESRWIVEVLDSLRPLCDRLYVMDDHSADDTAALAAKVPGVIVLPSPFMDANEARDKDWLLSQILADCDPAWVVHVDGDEVLEKRGPDVIRAVCASPDATAFRLKVEYLWNSLETVRVDRVYGDFWRPSIFRPRDETGRPLTFATTVWGGGRNLHCTNVPGGRIAESRLCPARLKHYGYMDRDDRVKKLDHYTTIDPRNDAEDWYRHVCQGDMVTVTELSADAWRAVAGPSLTLYQADATRLLDTPADATLLHAGPLRVEPWDEDAPWSPSAWARRTMGG